MSNYKNDRSQNLQNLSSFEKDEVQARGVLTSQLNRTRWDLAQISGYADQALLAHRWKRTAWKNEKFWESWMVNNAD